MVGNPEIQLTQIQEQRGVSLRKTRSLCKSQSRETRPRLTHTDSQLTVCWVTMQQVHLISHWETSVWTHTDSQLANNGLLGYHAKSQSEKPDQTLIHSWVCWVTMHRRVHLISH